MSHLFGTDQVCHTIELLHPPGEIFEIRILKPSCQDGSRPNVLSGFFDNSKNAIDALEKANLSEAQGFYISFNSLSLNAKTITNSFSLGKTGSLSADKDISHRQWVLIDVDPNRPSGSSATNNEKAFAILKGNPIREYLNNKGWPEPIFADSGNGLHLLYAIETSASCPDIKPALKVLDNKFSDKKVKIDTSVHNAAQITKLYGTKACKGNDTANRPHRFSRIIKAPDNIEVVSPSLLSSLAKKAPFSPRKKSRISDGEGWSLQRMQQFIDTNLSEFQPSAAIPYEGGHKWVFQTCPFYKEHDDRSAAVFRQSGGTLGFKCHHNGCADKQWKDVREKFKDYSPTSTEGDQQLAEEHGQLAYFDSKGRISSLNQMFIAARYVRDTLVLFDTTTEEFSFYRDETGLWIPETDDSVIVSIGTHLQATLTNFGYESALNKRTTNLLRQILTLVKGLACTKNPFQRNTQAIHVENGMLIIGENTVEFTDFSPNFYSRNRSEITYDPDCQCPRFLNELLIPTLSTDDIELLQKLAGQFLLGENISQTILIIQGAPGAGKSTSVFIIELIIGRHNIAQLRVNLLSSRFEIADYYGKTLLSGKDVPGDFLNNPGAHVLKSLSGGDLLSAEVKNVKKRFQLEGKFNVAITSNSKLRVHLDSDSGAWRRRLAVINFEQAPSTKPIPYFANILVKEEGSGILNWCIDGAQKLLTDLKTFGKIQLGPTQQRRIEAVLSESDSIRNFALNCIIKAEGHNITTAELLSAYYCFCNKLGWQAEPARKFENSIPNIMLELFQVAKRTDIQRDGKNQRGFSHVTLKSL
jgi:P4 family phage/plasmid primase-like protien